MSGNSNYLLDTSIVLFLLAGDRVLADIIGDKIPYISMLTADEEFGKLKLLNNLQYKR